MSLLIKYPQDKDGVRVIIPISVTDIGEKAFGDCTNFTSIVCYAEIPPSLGIDVFQNVSNDIILYVQEGSTSLYQQADQWKNFSFGGFSYDFFVFESDGINYEITSLIAPYTVEVISKAQCYEGDVVIPEKITFEGIVFLVTNIGDEAFYGCVGLTSIEIPTSVTNIGRNAFSDCTRLTYIEIPNSVTNIAPLAFRNCTDLKSIYIPNSVTTIGFGAFYTCDHLESVVISNSVTDIGGAAFYRCIRLKSIVIPHSVNVIGDNAFSGCSSLSSISISNSETKIGERAFALCHLRLIKCYAEIPPDLGLYVFQYNAKLIPLYVPASSVALYQQADQWNDFNIVGITDDGDFEENGIAYDINILKVPFTVEVVSKELNYQGDVVIPDYVVNEGITYSVDGIGERAFSGSNGLKSIENPQIVLKNGNAVYELSTGLTSIEIPKSVTNIGNGAFENCIGLTAITCLADNPPVLGLDVFKNVPKDIPLYVPANSVALYQQADQWKEFNIVALVTTSRRNTTETRSNIEIYPNPVSYLLNIDLGGFHGEVSFEIFNAAGQFILSGQFASTKTINTGSFEPGIYVIRMNGDNWVETKRFIKK